MDGGVGHGRSLASGHAARRPRSGSIAAMVALILADGDAPSRARTSIARGRAGTRRSSSSSRPTAARGMRGASESRSTCGSATATRSARTRWPSSRPPACRSNGRRRTRTNPTPSWRSAPRSACGHDGVLILGALGGGRIDHALANVGLLAMPELAGREAAILDARSRTVAHRARPGPDGAAVARPLPGRPGDLVSLLPLGAGVEGVTTRGLAYPLADEPLARRARPRAVERPLDARRGGHRPARPAARRGVACYALSHEHACRRRPRARGRPAR